MHTHLTPAQHALLQTELQLARARVAGALQAQLGGASRIAHARDLLTQDPHEAREHEGDRDLDLGRTDQLTAELRELDAALVRLAQPGYGRCLDCGRDIPFQRLQHQPQALRCVDCQAAHEASSSR